MRSEPLYFVLNSAWAISYDIWTSLFRSCFTTFHIIISLLSVFILFFAHVIFVVTLLKCWAQHFCKSCSLPIAILNRTCSIRSSGCLLSRYQGSRLLSPYLGSSSSQDRPIGLLPAKCWPEAFHATFIHNIQRKEEDRIWWSRSLGTTISTTPTTYHHHH